MPSLNPYEAPLGVDNRPVLTEPIVLEGTPTFSLINKAKRQLRFKQQFGLFVWILIFLMFGIFVAMAFIQHQKATARLLTEVFASPIVLIAIALMAIPVLRMIWAKLRPDNVLQKISFDANDWTITNKHSRITLPYSAIHGFTSDAEFALIELGKPNKGIILLVRSWCTNDSDWETLCKFLRMQ